MKSEVAVKLIVCFLLFLLVIKASRAFILTVGVCYEYVIKLLKRML